MADRKKERAYQGMRLVGNDSDGDKSFPADHLVNGKLNNSGNCVKGLPGKARIYADRKINTIVIVISECKAKSIISCYTQVTADRLKKTAKGCSESYRCAPCSPAIRRGDLID